MKQITIGILAHVDAGKTTLSEAFLYLGGAIRALGRVDKKNTILDNFEAERDRGITIFSKCAGFSIKDTRFVLLDTPGHVDFAAEMERTLSVLDYAVLVVSGADGVQGHTKTLWKLLEQYQVPVFIFVNKMDQPGCASGKILEELQEKLDSGVLDFSKESLESEVTKESIAVCEEELMERYLAGGDICIEDIAKLVAERKIFPCYFGSALKLFGVEEFMEGMNSFTVDFYKDAGEEFGAKVYKISRDNQGNRLTHMKITGGKLMVKAQIGDGKVNQIRIYQGEKYEAVNEVAAGVVCAVTGLEETYPGQGLGIESDAKSPVLQPVLNYRMIFPKDVDALKMYGQIKVLQEEDPQLNISWNETHGEIEAKLMGEVQTEILKEIIEKRFDTIVSFGDGSIVYKETIKNVVEGVGHFEPLRHYAEVHLLMEPLEVGSGIVVDADVSEDVLDRNWQRLVLTHLKEKVHVGALTGSAITDVKITLINGKAHLKHTEGGDFRQATYRAVRHGLMKAESVLLEPFYGFVLEIPSENVGRALTDLDRMKAVFGAPEIEGENAVIQGKAPVSLMNGYQKEMIAYTKGKGSISLEYAGYGPCHNQEEVVERIGYVPEMDLNNPASSVFCAHGAGFVVEWQDVEDYMHLENRGALLKEDMDLENLDVTRKVLPKSSGSSVHSRYNNISYSDDSDLQEIFKRTYGEGKKHKTIEAVTYGKDNTKETVYKPQKKKKEYLLVDGYNVIHANEELKELLEVNLEAARNVLMDVLCNYQGFKKYEVILVFDAYKVKGNQGEVVKYHNINVVYTKEAETADHYIERTAHEIGRQYNVTVVTSDGVEQVIIRGAGCMLMSSREFWEDVATTEAQISEQIEEHSVKKRYQDRNYLFHYLDDELLEKLEQIRLGKNIGE